MRVYHNTFCFVPASWRLICSSRCKQHSSQRDDGGEVWAPGSQGSLLNQYPAVTPELRNPASPFKKKEKRKREGRMAATSLGVIFSVWTEMLNTLNVLLSKTFKKKPNKQKHSLTLCVAVGSLLVSGLEESLKKKERPSPLKRGQRKHTLKVWLFVVTQTANWQLTATWILQVFFLRIRELKKNNNPFLSFLRPEH